MKQLGLRQRLAWALGAMGAATALLLGLAFWISEETIEQAALRELMQGEIELLAGIPSTAHEHQLFFRPARSRPAPPSEWTALPPGTFRKVRVNGNDYQLLVVEAAPGDRIYLAQSLRVNHWREGWMLLALALSVTASGLLAVAVSGRLSRLALQPLQALLERVRALRPEQRGQRLQPAPETPELDVLIHALNDYMQALDRVVAQERAFAGAAAHELHTPLTVIGGAAELLESRLPQDPALARIQRAAAEATQMLDLLLSLSATREAPPAVALCLNEELPRLARLCPARAGVSLHWDLAEAVELRAPAAALSLVFLNLLRNALRAATSAVHVRLRPGCVTLADDGAGIAPGLLATAFEPGVRGSEGGSGLGLHIARAVAERQGWRLSLGNGAQGGAVAELSWT